MTALGLPSISGRSQVIVHRGINSRFSVLLAAIITLSLAACGPKTAKNSGRGGHEHEEGETGGHHDHGQEAAGATFAEGKGIALIDETKNALGLKTVEAEERKIIPFVWLEAQVYRAASEPSRVGAEQTGFAYAAALVASPEAANLNIGNAATLKIGEASYEATVWRVEPASKEAVNSIEVILQIPDPAQSLKVGEFVSGSIAESGMTAPVITVPRSSILETAIGKFVFVENGAYLLRTPVATGAESAEFVEITDGVYAGDVVVTTPVETLYLIELRATKGGGHSH